MSRQRTITVQINPSYRSLLDEKRQLSKLAYKDGFLIAGYVPDLNDRKTRNRILNTYLYPMNFGEGERLVKRIKKQNVKSLGKEEIEYLSRKINVSAEDIQTKIQKRRLGHCDESLEIALYDYAIEKAGEIWKRDYVPKLFPPIYELAMLEGRIPNKEQKKKLIERREQILEEARKFFERDSKDSIKWVKKEIDNFNSEIKNFALIGRKHPNRVLREVLSSEDRLDGLIRLPTGFHGEADIINYAVTELVKENFPGAKLAELESFGDKKNEATFRIIYSENAPSIPTEVVPIPGI